MPEVSECFPFFSPNLVEEDYGSRADIWYRSRNPELLARPARVDPGRVAVRAEDGQENLRSRPACPRSPREGADDIPADGARKVLLCSWTEQAAKRPQISGYLFRGLRTVEGPQPQLHSGKGTVDPGVSSTSARLVAPHQEPTSPVGGNRPEEICSEESGVFSLCRASFVP